MKKEVKTKKCTLCEKRKLKSEMYNVSDVNNDGKIVKERLMCSDCYLDII